MGKKVKIEFDPLNYHDGPPQWMKEMTSEQRRKFLEMEKKRIANAKPGEDLENCIIELPD